MTSIDSEVKREMRRAIRYQRLSGDGAPPVPADGRNLAEALARHVHEARAFDFRAYVEVCGKRYAVHVKQDAEG